MSEPTTPSRYCNGGPNGHSWCGAVATVVCNERSQGQHRLQWFACAVHTEGALTEPIASWFARLDEIIAAE